MDLPLIFREAGFITPLNYDNVIRNNSINLYLAYYTISRVEVNDQFWTYYITIAEQVGQFWI